MASFTWVIATILYVFFDVAYFLRGITMGFLSKMCKTIQGRKGILDEVVNYGICLTTDLDFLWHMNNARYLRECDFGRYSLWLQNGVYETVARLGGGVTLSASTIRYRKSLELLDTYKIKTRILCWDDKAFYVEQRMVRLSDNFVCAICLMRQALLRVSPLEVLRELGESLTSPPIPDEVATWISYNQLSSEKLKKSL